MNKNSYSIQYFLVLVFKITISIVISIQCTKCALSVCFFKFKYKLKNIYLTLYIIIVGSQFVAQAQKIWDMSLMSPIQ